MTRLVSRAEFAKRAGISRQMVAKLLKGKLSAGLVDKKIDLDAHCVFEYLSSRNQALTPAPAATPEETESAAKKNADLPPEIDRYILEEVRRLFPELSKPADVWKIAKLTIEQVAEQFGTIEGVKDYVEVMKKIADWKKVQLQIAEKQGILVPRELISVSIFGALESLNVRLLSDAPRTISTRTYAMAKSEAPVEEAEAMIRKIISKHLKGVFKTSRRILKGK